MANAARVKYQGVLWTPFALQRCKLDAPLLAAGLLTNEDKKLLDELMDAVAEESCCYARSKLIRGYRLSLLMTMEVMSEQESFLGRNKLKWQIDEAYGYLEDTGSVVDQIKGMMKKELPLKTSSSSRVLPISDYVFGAILEERKKYERYRSRRSTVFHDYGYICCSSYSGKPRSKDFHWRHYKELLKKSGLSDIRWHDLRSTYCTLLLNKDFNPKAVSKLMGHVKELITMDVYGDNANIIPEEIPELLSYMEEVMPDRFRDDVTERTMQDIMVDVDKYLPKRKRSEENPN